VSDEQDAGVDFSRLWAIPLLLGFSGVYFHFRRDWKMASVLLVLFVFMGYLIAFYQNQQEPQPRERDYFYPGSFFVFAIWIALGVRGILDLIRDKLAGKRLMVPATVVTVILALLFVPVRMLFANYSTHDRSKNWLPWDFSYNLLQTCDKDAILFTNGDNDTFPLWYLQDVAGIRRDVRIVNLSLVNTPWYILQMKRKPYYPEAQAVPISLSDARIAAIQPVAWEPRQLTLPVPADVIVQYGNLDSTVVREGKISFLMRNTIQAGDTKGIRIQDEMVRDIVFTNAWRHPVYFATTCSPDSRIGLDDYLWYQGLAYRLEPRRVTREDAGVNEQKLKEDLLHEPQTFSRTPQDGFVFRGVADPHVFFDENASRMIYHYRMAFLRLVMFELNAKNDKATGLAALERMEEIMPRSKYPLGWEFASDIATFYYRLGKTDRFNELVPEIEQACQALIEGNRVNLNSYYNPYRVLLDIYEMKKDNAKTLELLRKLSVLFPNDPGIKQRIESLQVQMGSPSDTGSLHR
jgi:hypothetical protein